AGLRRTYEVQRHLDDLVARAEQESQEVRQRQEELRATNAALQAESRRLDLEVPDLAGEIEELSQGEGELELSRQKALSLGARLHDLQDQFVQRCQETLASHLQSVRDTEDGRRRAGGTVDSVELPGISPGASPGEAAQAVADVQAVLQRLAPTAKGLARKLEVYRAQAQEEIAKLHPEDLSPGDRQTAEQLSRELEGGSWSRPRHLLQRIQTLARLREKCKLFFERLLQEQVSAREKRGDLLQGLEAFREDLLDRFCPELTSRVIALVYGIPD